MLLADVSGFEAGMGKAKAEMAKVEGVGNTAFTGLASVGKMAFLGLGAAAIGGGVAALKMGGDFQSSMTQLVTGAGEARGNIDMVSKGILAMAGQVGTSATDLSKGMYNVESAGFHGATGLQVLRAAAEGAKVGAADMATVADGLTSALNAYHMPASEAARVTSELIATVAAGKMHVQDLASSLGTILPIASALNVPLEQITGAMATMTVQGTDAATASQSLRFMLAALAGPTAKAAAELKALGVGQAEIPGITAGSTAALKSLGLKTSEVADVLAKGDFPGALKMITDQIGTKFPAGSAQYEAALKAAVGGTRGFTAALELSGANAATWNTNIKSISGATAEAGGHVRGWADLQKDFNQHVARAVETVKALAIEIGLKLIPYAQGAMDAVAGLVGWFDKHRDVAMEVAAAIAGPLMVAIGFFIVGMATAAVATIAATWPLLLLVAAIAAVSAGVVWAYNNIKPFHQAVDAIIPTVKNVAKAIGDFAGVVIYVATHLSKFKDIVVNAIGGALVEASSKVGQIAAAITGAIGGAIAWVAQEIPKIPFQIGFALAFAVVKVMEFYNGVVEWLYKLPGKIVDWGISVLAEFGRFEVGLYQWAVRAIPTLVNNIVTFLGALPGRVNSWAWSVLVAVGQLEVHLINWARTAIPNFVASVMAELGRLPGQVWQIGADIVAGIAKGIGDSAWQVFNAIGNLISGAIAGAKAAGKGGSPYMLFADEVGAQMVAGVAMGINKSTAAADAMRAHVGMLSGISGSGSFTGGAMGGGAMAIAGGGGGGNISVGQIVINGANKDPRQIALEVRDELLRLKRSTGTLGLA